MGLSMNAFLKDLCVPSREEVRAWVQVGEQRPVELLPARIARIAVGHANYTTPPRAFMYLPARRSCVVWSEHGPWP